MSSTQAGAPGSGLNGKVTWVTVSSAASLITDYFKGGVILDCDSGSSFDLTIPTGLIHKQPCFVYNRGVGLVTIVAGVGVTIRAEGGRLTFANQYSWAFIVPDPNTANLFHVAGDLA